MKKTLLELYKKLDAISRDEKLAVHSPWSLDFLCRLQEQPMPISDAEKYLKERRSGYSPSKMLEIYDHLKFVQRKGDYLELADNGRTFLDVCLLELEEVVQKYK